MTLRSGGHKAFVHPDAAPGLIDTHIHGFGGVDASDGRLNQLSVALAKRGTTAFLPTTMTDSIENLRSITSDSISVSGAQIVGFHLEGPYISHAKKGAQNADYIKSANISEFSTLKNVKKITKLFGDMNTKKAILLRDYSGHRENDASTFSYVIYETHFTRRN